jgi:hypothetical protein
MMEFDDDSPSQNDVPPSEGAETTPPIDATLSELAAPPTVEEPKPAPAQAPAATPQEPSAPQTPAVQPMDASPAAPVDFAAQRTAFMDALEKRYAIPAELATQLLTEPEVVLPKLAAQVHMAAVEQTLAQLQGILPQAIEQVTGAQVRENQAKQEFYSAWPELKGYERQVLSAGQMFRQINPSATKEQAVQAIGQLAMQALGLQRAVGASSTPAVTSAPKPFQPAGAASAPQSAPKPAPSVWEDMTQDVW